MGKTDERRRPASVPLMKAYSELVFEDDRPTSIDERGVSCNAAPSLPACRAPASGQSGALIELDRRFGVTCGVQSSNTSRAAKTRTSPRALISRVRNASRTMSCGPLRWLPVAVKMLSRPASRRLPRSALRARAECGRPYGRAKSALKALHTRGNLIALLRPGRVRTPVCDGRQRRRAVQEHWVLSITLRECPDHRPWR